MDKWTCPLEMSIRKLSVIKGRFISKKYINFMAYKCDECGTTDEEKKECCGAEMTEEKEENAEDSE
jgi:hypothetical protein